MGQVDHPWKRAQFLRTSFGKSRRLEAGEVDAIRVAYADGAAAQDLATEYGVSKSYVLQLIRRYPPIIR